MVNIAAAVALYQLKAQALHYFFIGCVLNIIYSGSRFLGYGQRGNPQLCVLNVCAPLHLQAQTGGDIESSAIARNSYSRSDS